VGCIIVSLPCRSTALHAKRKAAAYQHGAADRDDGRSVMGASSILVAMISSATKRGCA
jgi:hypothetical protein